MRHPFRHGLRAHSAGDKKFRLSGRLREARYFPRSEYCRCLAVVPVAAVAHTPWRSSARDSEDYKSISVMYQREKKSKHLSTESITDLHVTRLQAGIKPSHALLAGAMGKAVRLRVALAFFLQGIVTNSRGSI